jgi:8-oxo-dGTP pyrophosphatase MutT (NUDIX family)
MRRNPIYFGKAGAGILFFSSDQSQVLLTLRSGRVQEPFTWGIPGGAVSVEGMTPYIESQAHTPTELPLEVLLDTALKEAEEELGSIPDVELLNPFDTVKYRDGGFTYTTFFISVDTDLEDWELVTDWENIEARWFETGELPKNLHFGVSYLVSQRPNLF